MENSVTSSIFSGPTNAAPSTSNTSDNNISSTRNFGNNMYYIENSRQKDAMSICDSRSSPNPQINKDKDAGKSISNQGAQGGNGNPSAAGNATASTGTTSWSITTIYDLYLWSRWLFQIENAEEQDDDSVKNNLKDISIGGQSTDTNVTSAKEKCTKAGKQNSGINCNESSQNAALINPNKKNPSASSMKSSRRPSTYSSSTTNSKTNAPAVIDEDDRSKGSDSKPGPKVRPLKIVISKKSRVKLAKGNTNRIRPYVVKSNDSTGKKEGQSNKGTTNPAASGTTTESVHKDDVSGALHGEKKSTYHLRPRWFRGWQRPVTAKNSKSTAVLPPKKRNVKANKTIHHSPTPGTSKLESSINTSAEGFNNGADLKADFGIGLKAEENTDSSERDNSLGNLESTNSTSSTATKNTSTPSLANVLPLKKRTMKPNKEMEQAATNASSEPSEAVVMGPENHLYNQPIANCYQTFLKIRKQIQEKRKGIVLVRPEPLQGFDNYLLNCRKYNLAGNTAREPNINPPVELQGTMKELYIEQEKERYRLTMQHYVEMQKLILCVEQEVLRVHGRAARAVANQSLPFSVCTILKDEEVYKVSTPEQEEKDRNVGYKYSHKLLLRWLKDVDDKWNTIKKGMLHRHLHEAQALHAVQRMNWEWKMKELGLCLHHETPQIENTHVPMVHKLSEVM